MLPESLPLGRPLEHEDPEPFAAVHYRQPGPGLQER